MERKRSTSSAGDLPLGTSPPIGNTGGADTCVAVRQRVVWGGRSQSSNQAALILVDFQQELVYLGGFKVGLSVTFHFHRTDTSIFILAVLWL